MKDAFWKITSFALMTILIIVVASWAPAMQDEQEKRDYAEQPLRIGEEDIRIEIDKERYDIKGFGKVATENEKIILWDTWDVENTKDIWFLKDPHTVRSRWVRLHFDKKDG